MLPDRDSTDRTPGRDRRRRAVVTGAQKISDVIASKVLHGWLQNRHQTLMPLSVNLGRMSAMDRDALVRFAAVAALAAPAPRERERALTAWLRSVGADGSDIATFEGALASPPAFHDAVEAVQDTQLATLAFVIALVAARPGGPAAQAFAEYVAIRLSVPSAAIRSAERRYRS